MKTQTISNEFTGSLKMEWANKAQAESHKAQISFVKNAKKNKENSETIYGLKESLLTRNAFTNLFLKF